MNQMVKQLESRIATWSQVPSSNGEPIQVLRYEAGQEYQAHYDYFFHESGRANNRVAKVLMYLSDVQVRIVIIFT
jgi:prolyl 4-hydroxylase